MFCNVEDREPVICSAPSPAAWGGVGMACALPENPWNKNKKEESLGQSKSSFKELMSEDLAKDLQQREEQVLLDCTAPKLSPSSNLLEIGTCADTSNDLLLALLLQHDYNKEHDSQIQREEKHFNKNSKLSVSFSKYKVCPETYDSDTDDENYNLDDENRALDSFEESRRSDPVIPASGYTRHNNVMVTKHDKTLSGRRNAERVMNFPPGINTGDAGGFDMQISNKVYNKLARSAMHESKRKQRVHDKVEKATSEKALDPITRLIIYKMVNNSILESVNGIVSTGKESVVFHALGGIYNDVPLPSELAVKVFKTTLTDFKTRERYIRDDYRYKDKLSKNNNKLTIQSWCEKEFQNLRRLQKAKIPSPTPLLTKKHVLVMSFIGNGQMAAPKLKHVRLPFEQWCCAYEQVVDMMTTMFRGCKLVHGDMSEYNILWYEDKCWIIDLGQAVEPRHKNALLFQHRDCSNIIGFFSSKGLPNLPSPLKLFEIVTGINLPGPENEAQRLIEEYERNKEMLRNTNADQNGEDSFEFLWSEIQKEENHRRDRDQVEGRQHASHDESCDVKSECTKSKKNKKKRKNKKSVRLSESDGDEGNEKGSSHGDFVYVESAGTGTQVRSCPEEEEVVIETDSMAN